MSNKVNAKLYKIEDYYLTLKNDFESFIEQMVLDYNRSGKKNYKQITLDLNLNNDREYKSKLFTYSQTKKPPKWIEFLEDIVEDTKDLKGLDVKNSSFILFVYSSTSLYAVTRGYYGRYLLEPYIDRLFGLDVLSRLVDKNATEIKQIDERGVFGVELGAQRYFRQDFNLIYDDDFGKIYNKMLASIDEESFEKLGIVKKRKDITKISINGSASFEVSTSFDHPELLQRIEKIDELLKTEGVVFNQFIKLSYSELSVIREELNNGLLKFAYDSYLNNESVDFYHPSIFNYLESETTRFNIVGDYLELDHAQNLGFLKVISRLIEEDIIDNTNEHSFLSSLRDCHGQFKKGEEPYGYEAGLSDWISGEIGYDGKNYFKLDNQWYKYFEGFNEYLDTFFVDINFDLKTTKLKLTDWNLAEHNTEGKYNMAFKNKDDFIVTDTALYNNLELSDLIRLEGDTIYLYHVKKGLGRDMRVLTNQITNASRVLQNAIKEGDNKILYDYYAKVSNKNYGGKKLEVLKASKKTTLSKIEFAKLFKSKRIAFVFAYSSNSSKTIKEEILATNSRVAKLSLIYAIRDMKSTEFDFLIERIQHV